MKRVFVPTINDDKMDFLKLFELYRECFEDPVDIILDFSECNFLRQNGVAFIGGILNLGYQEGESILLDEDTIKSNVKTNLCQNGFATRFFDEFVTPWTGNSIPYQEFSENDFHSILPYLDEEWLGRGWMNIQEELKDDIVTRIYELFANSLEHSNSTVGCFSCGQNYNYRHELTLSLVDFGRGIPNTVLDHLKGEVTDTLDAMRWAITEGNSTREVSKTGYRGGMGLSLVQDFLTLNGGCMEIYSNDCLYGIKGEEIYFEKLDVNFRGTFVNIKLLRDSSFYGYQTN